MRRVLLALASVLLTATVFIGAFELVQNVRYRRWREEFTRSGWLAKMATPSPNPELMWEYRPYAEEAPTLHGERDPIRTNRYGFRDFDYRTPAKPPGVYRVAFVGDSVTLGMFVREEETFVRRFQTAANELALPYRIHALNFGIDGYNTPQVAELVRTRVLDFQPDRVIYVLCLNDVDLTESAGFKIRYFRKPWSFFLLRVERAWEDLSGIDFYVYRYRKNKEIVFGKLGEMRDLLEAEGVAFQVVVLPLFHLEESSFEAYPAAPAHSGLVAHLRIGGYDDFDLLPVFAASGRKPATFALDVWHPNPRGHRLISRALVRRFADEMRRSPRPATGS